CSPLRAHPFSSAGNGTAAGDYPVPRSIWSRILLLAGGGSTAAFLGFLWLDLLAVLGMLGPSGASGTTNPYGPYSASPVVAKSGGTTAGQSEFAGALVACSGLDPNVALACAAARGGGHDRQPPNNSLLLTTVTRGSRSF